MGSILEDMLDKDSEIIVCIKPQIKVIVHLHYCGDGLHSVDISLMDEKGEWAAYPPEDRVNKLGLDFIEQYRGYFSYRGLSDELVIKTINFLKNRFGNADWGDGE